MSVRGQNGRLRVDTSDGPLEAPAVVVATGTMQTPRRPGIAESVPPRIRQLDAETHRNGGTVQPGRTCSRGDARWPDSVRPRYR